VPTGDARVLPGAHKPLWGGRRRVEEAALVGCIEGVADLPRVKVDHHRIMAVQDSSLRDAEADQGQCAGPVSYEALLDGLVLHDLIDVLALPASDGLGGQCRRQADAHPQVLRVQAASDLRKEICFELSNQVRVVSHQ
jgi:hypothetical protein